MSENITENVRKRAEETILATDRDDEQTVFLNLTENEADVLQHALLQFAKAPDALMPEASYAQELAERVAHQLVPDWVVDA